MAQFKLWRTASAVLLVLCVAGQAAGWWPLPGLARLEQWLDDVRVAWVAPHAAEDRIVIVDIDEPSLREPEQGGEGRWPWPRERLAVLVERLFTEQGAALVGLDIILSGRHPQDAQLAQAMGLGPVVVGDAFHTGGGSSGEPPPGIDPSPWRDADVRIRSHTQSIGVVPTLRAAAAGSGHLHPLRDEDGVTRRVPLFIEHQGRWHPALVLSIVQVLSEAPPPQLRFEDYGGRRRIEAVEVAGLVAPVDEALQAIVPYRAAGHPLRSVSAADITQGRLAAGSLAGRIVLVGSSASGLADLVTTPVQASLPGVQVHGQLLAGMLDGRLLHQPAYARGAAALGALVAGLAVAFLGARLRPLPMLVGGLGLVVVAVLGNLAVLSEKAMMVPLTPLLLAVLLPLALHIVWGYMVESRSRRQMTELFAHYVPPEIVSRMAENPAHYTMKPIERELTVLFADVRGFTTISERLTPQELADWINEYLTGMSSVIRETYHGTLDKFIGDAVMAFWGAPVEEAKHAELAARAALAMQQEAHRLSLSFKARGWPPLSIGVGLNTGLMRVGDMGSRQRRAYTVMGDAVNLGSRLESLTRTYGVDVLIGPETRARLPDWICREVDLARVKGKVEPVAIYEPLGPAAEVPLDQRALVERWHGALTLIRAQRWNEAQTMLERLEQDDPGRALYALYRDRLAHWQTHPPGAGWDGVTTFEKK